MSRTNAMVQPSQPNCMCDTDIVARIWLPSLRPISTSELRLQAASHGVRGA
jgi:hypothetical protein